MAAMISVLVGMVAMDAPAATRDASYAPSGTVVADQQSAAAALDDAAFRCPASVMLPPPPDRTQALNAAKAKLATLAGGKALQAFAGSKAHRRADAIPASVMTALATGRPAAALAASLRGAELEPRQPRHLINAAVILIGYGDRQRADGLLTAAGKLKGSGAALGVSSAQALTAAEAELAVATGHFRAAEAMYRKLVARVPTMLAAGEGLSQALACQGKRAPAAAWHSRAQREMFDYVAADDGGGDSFPPAVDAGSVDELAGRDIVAFGGYYRPADQDDATAHASALRRALDAATARASAIQQRYVPAAIRASRAGGRYIVYAALVVDRDKEMARLQAENLQLNREYFEATRRTGEAQPPCYFSSQHAALWTIVDGVHTNHEALARRSHRLYTALAAGVADPAANQALNILADQLVAGFYASALAQAELVTRIEVQENGGCQANPATPVQGTGSETPEDSAPASAPCSAAKYQRLKIKLGAVASVEFNCEQGKVEVVPAKWGTDQAYIGAFGEAGVKWKSGDVTGIIGVKVAVATKDLPGLPEVGLGGKAGFYITVGPTRAGKLPPYGQTRKSWGVKDWGVRLQATAEVPGPSEGRVSTITKFDSRVDFTLVGVFN